MDKPIERKLRAKELAIHPRHGAQATELHEGNSPPGGYGTRQLAPLGGHLMMSKHVTLLLPGKDASPGPSPQGRSSLESALRLSWRNTEEEQLRDRAAMKT